MEIDHNPIERRPMEAFHCGDRAEELRIQEEFAAMFREEYREKDRCARRRAAITATARNVSRSIGRIRSTYPTVCAQCSIGRSKRSLN